MKFGRLTVIAYFKKGTNKMAHCRCECGNEKDVYFSNLKSGKTRSCGCLEYENRHSFNDLTKKTFGKLTVIAKTEERKYGSIVWLCQCSCGAVVKKDAHTLTRGDAKSCGCLHKKKHDASKKKFGELTVLHAKDAKFNWQTLWICLCSCGNICEVSYSNLYFGHTRSCGCLKEKEYRTVVDGTVIECLSSKIPKNNTSGVKGVYRCREKWIAYITFKRKRHYLGAFECLEEAKVARKNAEQKFFSPLIKRISKI